MRILIAEDDITSRVMLAEVLRKAGHEPVETVDGIEAWQVLQQSEAPRLAILDWMMPGMDGLEVLSRVRERENGDERVRSTYVIMLTTLGDKGHVVEGLDAGADDYLTKPFDHTELRARVYAGVRVIDSEDRLLDERDRLKDLVEERARLLVHADRMATVGTLAAGVAHEINNPATFIAGNIGVLEQCLDIVHEHMPDPGETKPDDRLAIALEELPRLGDAMRNGVERIQRIVDGLKSYSRRGETACAVPVDVESCIDQALELCHNRLKYEIEVERNKSETEIKALAEPRQLEQVLINLIINAADAMTGMPHRCLTMSTEAADGAVMITTHDTGPGIPDDVLDRIFDPFYTTKAEDQGTGLGLSISRNIVETFDGVLHAHNGDNGGAVFTVKLRAADRVEI